MTDNFRQKFRLLFTALILIAGLCGVITAQNESAATITGQVTDSTGAVIPNATLVITEKTTGLEKRVQSGEDGTYTIFPLNPGEYTLTIEQAGFKRAVQTFTLNAKDRRPIDVVLEVGSANETVTVVDEAPLLQDSATGQALVSGNQVTELPLNNRNFIRLLETIPGVTSDLADESSFGLTSTTSVSINGLRRNGVNYLVDGVSNTDVGSNITLLSAPTVDSIKEFKVLTSNYTAEIGRSGGGSVIIVTRGGGNEFHGSLYEFVRNDRFNANTFFNNRLGRNADGTVRARVPKLRYNNFGGTFSGPLPFFNFGEGGPLFTSGKNKTFFFFSEEQRRIIRGISDSSASVPTAAERNGDFSRTLAAGLPLCRTAAGAVTTTCTGTNTPITAVDTAGNTIQIRQNQIFRADGVPYAGNIIPAGDIDPRSRGLLAAYPLPNTGVNGFTFSPANINNTRQEVFRIDHNFTGNHKIFGRYTRDTSDTLETGGLFNGILLPDVSTTNTRVPGRVFALSYTGVFSSSLVNEIAYNYSSNVITSDLIGRGRKSDYANGTAINEFFPENTQGIIPSISTRYTLIGSTQGYTIEYQNHAIRDVLTYTRNNHTFKFGAELTKEAKNENLGGGTSGGAFTFSPIQTQGFVPGTTAVITGTGDSFASFLLGRANVYAEAQFDPRVNFRFGRREFFAQDTWKIRPNVTLDFGVRYQLFLPPTDENNLLVSFNPDLYQRPNAPIFDPANPSGSICANATCQAFNTAVLNPLNGISRAGINSPFGRRIYPTDKNNFSPRVGLAYQPNFESGIGKFIFGESGKSVIRLGYGFYYDQPLVGITENATFFTPPVNTSVSFTSTPSAVITFSNPGAPFGGSIIGATFPARNLANGAISPDFQTPEAQVYSVGIQREVFKNAVVDISYVGTKGDHLIRRRNINFVTPADVVRVGTANVNAARPYLGYAVITQLETSAKSRYNGLLSSFNYRLANGFTITLAYTFSKTLTDSTNDRDAVDDPQNPFDVRPEYAEARTSRPHVFSASYVYELPFFRNSENSLVRLLLGGYQISGITNFESGAPVARVTVADTLTTSRGLYPNVTGDPNSGLAGTIDPATGLPFIFDPLVFTPAPVGSLGSAARAFARLPGRKQTNLALSKQFYFNKERTTYIQLRAESFNLFNTTQFTGVGTTLPTAGALSTAAFARPSGTRLPREFQFGIKFYF